MAEAPYRFGPAVTYDVTDGAGLQRRITCLRHHFKAHRLAQRYDRIEPLMKKAEVRIGRVRGAQAHLLEAPALWKRALEAMRKDPLFFVEPIPDQA